MSDAVQDTRTPEEVEADIALKRADLRLKELEQEQKAVDVAKTRALLRIEESRAAQYDLEVAKKLEVDQLDKANDHYHRVYHFIGEVKDATVESCMDRLTLWDRIDPSCDIEIVFNSPGGSVVSGMALFDHILDLRKRGHKVTTTASGVAASMAGILLQAGDVRRMGPGAWVLIHEVSGGVMGSYGDMVDRVDWIRRVQDHFLGIFADRSRDANCEKPLTKKDFEKNWKRKDWWLSADECLRHGIVDEVV